jgi:hypothetical protein
VSVCGYHPAPRRGRRLRGEVVWRSRLLRGGPPIRPSASPRCPFGTSSVFFVSAHRKNSSTSGFLRALRMARWRVNENSMRLPRQTDAGQRLIARETPHFVRARSIREDSRSSHGPSSISRISTPAFVAADKPRRRPWVVYFDPLSQPTTASTCTGLFGSRLASTSSGVW